MDMLNTLQVRVNNLNKLRKLIPDDTEDNKKYIESLNWAIKVCQSEVNRKKAKRQLENRW